jgi:tetratricopeptide (TPR) repeat protein
LDEGLGQLVELWLLEASERLDETKRRYSLHPLTRAFAQNRLSEYLDLECQPRVRLAVFFEHFAISAGGDRYSWERYDEIEEEKDNIFTLIHWCFENGEATAGMKLTKSVTFFMSIRGFYYEAKIFGHKAVEAARQQDKTDDLAWLLVKGIGWREIHGGDLEKGEALVREGLKIYENIEDPQGIRNALFALGRALRHKGDFNGARQYYKRGMSLAESSLDEFAFTNFKRELSVLAAAEDKLMEAKDGLESIVPILREQNELALAGTLANLAEVNHNLRNYETAFNVGIEGLILAKKMKKRYAIAWISLVLANTETERGNYQSALTFAQQALEIYEGSRFHHRREIEVKTLIKELQEKLAIQSAS